MLRDAPITAMRKMLTLQIFKNGSNEIAFDQATNKLGVSSGKLSSQFRCPKKGARPRCPRPYVRVKLSILSIILGKSASDAKSKWFGLFNCTNDAFGISDASSFPSESGATASLSL